MAGRDASSGCSIASESSFRFSVSSSSSKLMTSVVPNCSFRLQSEALDLGGVVPTLISGVFSSDDRGELVSMVSFCFLGVEGMSLRSFLLLKLLPHSTWFALSLVSQLCPPPFLLGVTLGLV